MKFFGNLAVTDSPQQICEQYPAFLQKVFNMAEGHETTLIGVAVDTLGVLGSNMEGKQVLQKTGNLLPLWETERSESPLNIRM